MNQTAWANALIGRIFWDFLREKHWADVVSHKIQKKLSKIRVRAVLLKVTVPVLSHRKGWISFKKYDVVYSLQLPYFMNELTLTELDMGSSMPQITATSRPEVNHRGEYRPEIKHCKDICIHTHSGSKRWVRRWPVTHVITAECCRASDQTLLSCCNLTEQGSHYAVAFNI